MGLITQAPLCFLLHTDFIIEREVAITLFTFVSLDWSQVLVLCIRYLGKPFLRLPGIFKLDNLQVRIFGYCK